MELPEYFEDTASWLEVGEASSDIIEGCPS
jgi:hypothetical protein